MQDQPSISDISTRVRSARLTYLSETKIRTLAAALDSARTERIPGLFIEAGVGLGGSAILIAGSMPSEASFRGYDIFSLIPRPALAKDGWKAWARYLIIRSGLSPGISGDPYYGYRDNLYEMATANLAAFGLPVDDRRIRLIKGLFSETLFFSNEDRIAFAHLDCDWYEPVRLCLERIHSRLSPGGSVVLDDYFTYAGCRSATDEFMAAHPGYSVTARAGSLWIRKRFS